MAKRRLVVNDLEYLHHLTESELSVDSSSAGLVGGSDSYADVLADDRIASVNTAGDDFSTNLETIRVGLEDDTEGTSLANLIESQQSLNESDYAYQVRSGLPKLLSDEIHGPARSGQVKRGGG